MELTTSQRVLHSRKRRDTEEIPKSAAVDSVDSTAVEVVDEVIVSSPRLQHTRPRTVLKSQNQLQRIVSLKIRYYRLKYLMQNIVAAESSATTPATVENLLAPATPTPSVNIIDLQ